MVLESKGEPSTDGIQNRIGIKGVSYTRNEDHKKELVHIEIDMPPANGHLVSLLWLLSYIYFKKHIFIVTNKLSFLYFMKLVVF